MSEARSGPIPRRDQKHKKASVAPRSIIFTPCALQPYTDLDRGRRRHLGLLTYRRSGLSPRCRSASSLSPLRWSDPSRSTRRSFRYRLRTHRARQPHFRPRRCCADLRRAPPDRFRSAHPDTRSPRVTAVSGRAAATIPRVGRVTTIGRIMATAIPSAGSPASDLAPVASIASPSSTVDASTVAASTVGRLFMAQPSSAVSALGSDIWAASAGDNWTMGTISGARSEDLGRENLCSRSCSTRSSAARCRRGTDAIRFKAATERLLARMIEGPGKLRDKEFGTDCIDPFRTSGLAYEIRSFGGE